MAFKPFKVLKGLLIKEENTNLAKQIEITPGGTANTKTSIVSSQTTDKTLTLPDATDTLVGKTTTDILSNKSIDADTNTITNIENVDIKAAAGIDASKIANGVVSNAEFQQLDGLTSSAVGTTQAQTLTNKTISGSSNIISNVTYSSLNLSNSIVNADINTTAAIDAVKLADGSVTNAELQFINSLTSNAQTQLNGKLNLTGGTLSGALDLGGNKITSLGTPTVNTDAATKLYADGLVTNVANRTLSNLSSPTNINQTLIFTNAFAGSISSGTGANSSTMDVSTGNASAGTSGAITVTTGTASINNNSGNITLTTGAVSGTGVRGTINKVDASLASAAVGHVWTLTNTGNGAGQWSTPAATPTPVAFSATKTGGNSNGASGVNTFTTTNYDTNSGFNLSTGEYTIKVAGNYTFRINLEYSGLQTLSWIILKNGATLDTYGGNSGVGGANYHEKNTYFHNCAVNDVIKCISSSGSIVNLISTYFEGRKVL